MTDREKLETDALQMIANLRSWIKHSDDARYRMLSHIESTVTDKDALDVLDYIDNVIDNKMQLDSVYAERNMCVALLAHMALKLGYRVGMRQSSDFEPGWQKCVMIDLPSGQVSWHIKDEELPNFRDIPTYPDEWDGHSTEEKYNRVLSACAAVKISSLAPYAIITDTTSATATYSMVAMDEEAHIQADALQIIDQLESAAIEWGEFQLPAFQAAFTKENALLLRRAITGDHVGPAPAQQAASSPDQEPDSYTFWSWPDLCEYLESINPYKPLITQIDIKQGPGSMITVILHHYQKPDVPMQQAELPEQRGNA